MIQIKPSIDLNLQCPYCNGEAVAKEYLCTGMHNMMLVGCKQCSKELHQEMPVNAGGFYSGMLDLETKKRVDHLPFDNWYLSGLVEAYENKSDRDVNLEVRKFKGFTGKKVAVLNTIDATYGHALYELFNASYYINRGDVDLVIIVQKEFVWLLPDNIAEAWIVDIGFGAATQWYDSLAKKVNDKLAAFNEVYLCQSFVQADESDYNIEDYTKIKPFPLEEWDERLLERPVVTFIWRNDRFWRKMLPRLIDNGYSRRIFPKLLDKVSIHLQHKWILKFAEEFRQAVPQVDLAIAGMDTRDRKIPSWIKDYRYPKHNDDTAREQLGRYAQSHLVLGCNGSSLVLPGCMAGSMINITPGDQWSVCVGTFPFRITSTGDTHYRYTMLPSEVSIKRLVTIAVAVLRDRSYNELHFSSPWRDHDSKQDPFAWSRFRLQMFDNLQQFNKNKGIITTKKK